MVSEPDGLAHASVLAMSNGELQFIDFRMDGGSEGHLGIFKTVQAHSRGNLTAVTGHPNAPLIATGTATQVRVLQLLYPKACNCQTSSGKRSAHSKCCPSLFCELMQNWLRSSSKSSM